MMSTRFLHGSPSSSNKIWLTISARSRAGAYMLQGYRHWRLPQPEVCNWKGCRQIAVLFHSCSLPVPGSTLPANHKTAVYKNKKMLAIIKKFRTIELLCWSQQSRNEVDHIMSCHLLLHACRGRGRMGHLGAFWPLRAGWPLLPLPLHACNTRWHHRMWPLKLSHGKQDNDAYSPFVCVKDYFHGSASPSYFLDLPARHGRKSQSFASSWCWENGCPTAAVIFAGALDKLMDVAIAIVQKTYGVSSKPYAMCVGIGPHPCIRCDDVYFMACLRSLCQINAGGCDDSDLELRVWVTVRVVKIFQLITSSVATAAVSMLSLFVSKFLHINHLLITFWSAYKHVYKHLLITFWSASGIVVSAARAKGWWLQWVLDNGNGQMLEAIITQDTALRRHPSSQKRKDLSCSREFMCCNAYSQTKTVTSVCSELFAGSESKTLLHGSRELDLLKSTLMKTLSIRDRNSNLIDCKRCNLNERAQTCKHTSAQLCTELLTACTLLSDE